MSQIKPLPEDRELDTRERIFVAEYCVHRNVERAAAAAGYSETMGKTKCYMWVSDGKTKPHVYKAIQQNICAVEERLQIKAEAVAELIWNQATANPNELIEIRRGACRYCYGDNHRYQRTPSEFRNALARYLELNRLAAKKGLEPLDEAGLNFDVQGGIGFRKKRDPHPDCPECEGEGVMYEYVKDTRKLSPAGLALFAGVKLTKDGIELKTNSQDKARELIGRHKGLFADLMKSDEDVPAPVGITFEVKSARKPE